ncbi:MAG: glutaredoxin 3 [Gammaproteobacteria bacterium]|nr:glutaredoxin 3 [Gammaproteobacteria bacterium]MCF6258811.1 glutaredoxin 3 [Gammaproteobacteria bacterium]
MSEITRQKKTPEIVIYTAAFCGYCAGAKSLLKKKGAAYLEIRVDEEAGKREEMEQRAGRDSVPQIFIGDQHIGGFDELVELDMDDELDSLLGLE